MSPFWERFPELAAQETRVLTLPTAQGGLPAGRFGLLELYCDDPTCDCRRVLLQVRSEARPDTILATINYGWDTVAFYTRWLHGDRAGAGEITRAELDPLNPQTKFAPAFLHLFQSVVLLDLNYIQRLQRHYARFKQLPPPASPASDPGAAFAAQAAAQMKPAPTERQGQFLAYIHQYSVLNGCAPAERDMQRFFQITPPSVHAMVLMLERRGFIQRRPGQVRMLVAPESLPPLKRIKR